METTLIIIILLLIGAFNLATLGALILLIYKMSDTPYPNKKTTENAAPQPLMDKSEEEAERRKKKDYEDQLSAINEMLNYNADVAYGIKPNDKY